MKKVILGAFLLLAIACTYSATKNALQSIQFSFRYNTLADDGKNYLAWKTDGTKQRDSFDAVSGASAARSTQNWAAFATVSKNKVMPKGLRALLLFAVNPRQAAQDDALSVSQEGRQLTIQFVHRGIAYRIQSDSHGLLDTESSFFLAENVAENKGGVFSLVREVLPGGKRQQAAPVPGEAETDVPEQEAAGDGPAAGEHSPEEPAPLPDDGPGIPAAEPAKEQEEAFVPEPYEGDASDMHNIVWDFLDLQPDKASDKAEKYYSGKLKASYKKGVLKISGRLTPRDKEAPEAEK